MDYKIFYFDHLPDDIINIIVSKQDPYSYSNFINAFTNYINLNYKYILSLMYPEYFDQIIEEFKNIGPMEYNIVISTIDIKNKIKNKKIENMKTLYENTQYTISPQNLSILPKEIGYLRNLKELQILKNNISEIPMEINYLQNSLIKLKISLNNIVSLDIQDLTNLEYFYIMLDRNNTQMVTFPKSIFNLTKLKHLYFLGFKFEYIPEDISKLSNLETLLFTSKKLVNCPLSLSKLVNLVTLHFNNVKISDMNLITSNLIKLKKLDLMNNNTKIIPDNISNLIELKRLNLSGGMIKSLPLNLSILTNLDTLELSYNKINYIPQELSSLTNLRSLNIANNKLKSFPQELSSLTNLTILRIKNNKLISLNDIPNNLRSVISN